MPPARHGRDAVFSRFIATVFWVVVVGVVAVAVLAREGLALRLAIGGALAASVMIWSVYAEALRTARSQAARERTLLGRSKAELVALRREHGYEVAGLRADVRRLEGELELVRSSAGADVDGGPEADMWDAEDAPTVVDLALRRESHPATEGAGLVRNGVAGTA